MSFLTKKNYHSELKRTDWDFATADNNGSLASYHWYPARFIPQVPGILINYFSDPGDTVLDPFCGSGTTLVEAYKFGRRANGIDLNPIAVLISMAKILPFDENSLSEYSKNLLGYANKLNLESQGKDFHNNEAGLIIPNYDENRQWYHQDTLRELSALWTAIHNQNNSLFDNVGLAAFSAILRTCCSQEKHWGWICDNCKPTVLIYKDAIRKYADKLVEYQKSKMVLEREAEQLREIEVPLTEFNVHQGDCSDVLKRSEQLYDLVITSPPYPGLTDSILSQRLSYLWFDWNRDELRRKEIGARYKRFRKNFLEEYLREMSDTFKAIGNVLKPGRFCCLVIGESPNREPIIKRFTDISDDMGFVHDLSLSRKIAKQRSLYPVLDREQIIILRKN